MGVGVVRLLGALRSVYVPASRGLDEQRKDH